MQRVLLAFFTLLALYACTPTLPYKPGEEKPAAPVGEAEIPAPTPAPVPETVPPPIPEAIVVEPIVVDKARAIPHIALLLPLRSPIFGTSASAVERGFKAAAKLDGQILPIEAYDNFDENNSVVSEYRQAVSNGALAVVGPITRNGVTALAESRNTPVPTLSLNVIDTTPAQNTFYFGMAIEAEARQIAHLARQKNLNQAIIITTREQLSKRLQAAFEDEWNAAGGTILREIEFGDNASIFADITEIPGTMIFIATDAKNARLVRPYLSNKLPDYATSRVFVGNSNTLLNYDLNGIRFVDMPWLLQPDHPAVMIYPRASPPLSTDQERLYALGIDAYRLVRLMLFNRVEVSLPLDGVSGQIRLNGHIFQRNASPALFVQGQAQLADAPAVPAIQMFPEQPGISP